MGFKVVNSLHLVPGVIFDSQDGGGDSWSGLSCAPYGRGNNPIPDILQKYHIHNLRHLYHRHHLVSL